MNFMEPNKNIQFHDDKESAFRPLIDYLVKHEWEEDIEETLGQYMYMFHDEEKTYYKHFGDRSYFNIFRDGKTEGKLQDWRDWD